MPRYVVLLRGVNVGKGNRVPMAEFKGLLERLRCSEVKTLLNSGNATFVSADRSGAKIAATIAGAVEDGFGVRTPVIVKSAAEIDRIISQAPMVPADDDHSRFLVAFAPDEKALQALSPLLQLTGNSDRLVITHHAAYLHCKAGLLQSQVGAAMLGKAGRGVTTRNWATVLKIAALLGVAA